MFLLYFFYYCILNYNNKLYGLNIALKMLILSYLNTSLLVSIIIEYKYYRLLIDQFFEGVISFFFCWVTLIALLIAVYRG